MDPIDSMGSGNGMMPSPEPMLTQICLHMVPLDHNELTHWGRDKMAATSQTLF